MAAATGHAIFPGMSDEQNEAAGNAGGTAPEPLTPKPVPQKGGEIGGPPGPEPTRYGDWERNGRCTDF